LTFTALALALAACGGGRDEAASNAADSEPAANAATEAPAPVPTYTLGANGLEPGLAFGMKQEDAIKAATAAFGPGGKIEHNDECGEGPMDFVSFGGLSLGFQEGKLAGWSLYETEPALRTKNGLTVGAPRSALGDLEIDEESSLGPEFDSGGIGGTLDEKGEKVEALWAGLPCQFR
jgi:hypothetical protein